MREYIGTKMLMAKPMNRADYNEYRDWDLPEDEDGTDEGYLVEYPDGDSNHPEHNGYISWSPKAQFEEAYRITNGLDFGLALAAMKHGEKVARRGWNGKGMHIEIAYGAKGSTMGDFILMDTTGLEGNSADDGKFRGVIPWLASQTDMLSEDWRIIKED